MDLLPCSGGGAYLHFSIVFRVYARQEHPFGNMVIHRHLSESLCSGITGPTDLCVSLVPGATSGVIFSV